MQPIPTVACRWHLAVHISLAGSQHCKEGWTSPKDINGDNRSIFQIRLQQLNTPQLWHQLIWSNIAQNIFDIRKQQGMSMPWHSAVQEHSRSIEPVVVPATWTWGPGNRVIWGYLGSIWGLTCIVQCCFLLVLLLFFKLLFLVLFICICRWHSQIWEQFENHSGFSSTDPSTRLKSWKTQMLSNKLPVWPWKWTMFSETQSYNPLFARVELWFIFGGWYSPTATTAF